MLPNILPTSNADHVPVLADEVRELLRVQPGETVVDATFGAGGHATLLAEDLAGERQARRDRPRPRREVVLRPLQGACGNRRALPARRLRDRPHAARRQRDQGRRDPPRPRHLVDAGRPARAGLLVRDRRAARHADGPVLRDDGRGDRQHLGRAGARLDLPALRRGAVRGADRPRDRPAPDRAALHAHGRPRRRDQARRSRRRRASARATLRSASSRRCASR